MLPARPPPPSPQSPFCPPVAADALPMPRPVPLAPRERERFGCAWIGPYAGGARAPSCVRVSACACAACASARARAGARGAARARDGRREQRRAARHHGPPPGARSRHSRSAASLRAMSVPPSLGQAGVLQLTACAGLAACTLSGPAVPASGPAGEARSVVFSNRIVSQAATRIRVLGLLSWQLTVSLIDPTPVRHGLMRSRGRQVTRGSAWWQLYGLGARGVRVIGPDGGAPPPGLIRFSRASSAR